MLAVRPSPMISAPGLKALAGSATDRSPPHPLVQRIEPHPINQLGGTLDVPDGEVAGLPRLQRADPVEAAERAGGFAGDAGQALVDGEAEQRGRHVHRQQQRGERRGAGIAVGGDRDVARRGGAAGRPAACASRARNRRRRAAARPRCRKRPGRRRPPRRDIPGDRPIARRTGRPARRRAGWRAARRAASPAGRAPWPPRNTRATCSGVKPMVSQKASTESARPAAATAGSMSRQTRAI